MVASRLRSYHLCAILFAFACVGSAPSADRGLGGSDPHPRDRHEYTAVRMGVAVRVVLHANDPNAAADAARAGFERMAVLEAILSDYQPQSELRLLGRQQGTWVPVSRVLFDVLDRSLEVARLTDGAFDPTVGPLVALWRRARDSGVAPTPTELDSARARVGWRKVQLDRGTRSVRVDPGVALDLGGVAKGYILGDVAGLFRESGMRQFLIEAGGDIVVGEAPPGRTGWSIAVATEDEAFAKLASQLVNSAISTSGGSEQFVEVGGERRSHVMDPGTGVGVTHEGTWHVIHPDAATADALATALSATDGRHVEYLLRHFPAGRAARSTSAAEGTRP